MRDDIRPAEILELLKRRIAGFDPDPAETEIGRVVQSGDGIAQVWGLPEVQAGELVEVETGPGEAVLGLVMNLEEDTVGVILFGGSDAVKEGQLVSRTKRLLEVPVGESLLGRVVDPLGQPIDGKGRLLSSEFRPVDAKGPGIIDRQNVCEPLQTGIKAIDAMIPIGRGQRELIIGDRRTGKTTLAIDTILNQKRVAGGPDQMHCFYVAIGQKRSSVVRLVELLESRGAMQYSTVIAATASDPASLLYLAPYSATAMAEYYRDSGRHALVVFDDLTKHAQAYRELSLLMRRSPGREAFPGDIFYVHSRLLERAAKMSAARGGGSLTALPMVETQEGDIAAYIPTNVISITDGQIFLAANLFNSGLRPALNVGISVSRVGGEAQVKAMKQVAGSLRIDLAQFRELAAFLQFSSELDAATRRHLDRGQRLTEILKQNQYSPLEVYVQVMILKAGTSGRLDRYPLDALQSYQEGLVAALDSDPSGFMGRLRAAGRFTPELEEESERVFAAFEATLAAGVSHSDPGYATSLALALSQSADRPEPSQLAEHLTSRELSAPEKPEKR
jgi:F-type H+-transporting ATPase subunit alpha